MPTSEADLQAKSRPCPVYAFNVLLEHSHIVPMTLLCSGQSRVVATETIWHAKIAVVAVGPFTEEVYQPLAYMISFNPPTPLCEVVLPTLQIGI